MYVKSFDVNIAVLKTYGRVVAQHPMLITKMLKSKGLDISSHDDRVVAQLEVCEEYLACPMLSGACVKRYSPLKNKLSNVILLGTDNYPKSRKAVLNMLNHYVSESFTQGHRPASQEDVSFIWKAEDNKGPRA